MKYTSKIFPFAPGIPWKIKYNQYVVPEIFPLDFWKKISSKDFIVAAYGGLIESFFSLSYFEILNQLFPSSKLYWAGDSKFLPLLKLQGLSSYCSEPSLNDLYRFPTPLFLDDGNFAIFNALYNYIDIYNIYNQLKYHDHKALFSQIFRNSLIPWDQKYIPQIRNLNNEIIKIHQLEHSPFVLIFPETSTWSNHRQSYLRWTPKKIKYLASLLSPKNIKTVILSHNPNRYMDFQTISISLNFNNLFSILPLSKIILSEEIDFLLLGILLSKAILVSEFTSQEFKLEKNKMWAGTQHEIYSKENIEPLDIYYLCK